MNNDTTWKHANADLFWGDLAFCDHVLQVYDNDELYIDAFAGFISSGLHLGDCCVVIATQAHRTALDKKLASFGIDVDAVKSDDSYISVDVNETLSKFMVNGLPDEKLLGQTMSTLFEKGYKAKRLIRAGGEMSPVLLAQGNPKGAVTLERLTNKVLETSPFSVFCGYSRTAFANGEDRILHHVCAAHSKSISGSKKQSERIHYCEGAIA